MAQQVVTADELADKIAEAFQRGVKFGQMIERDGGQNTHHARADLFLWKPPFCDLQRKRYVLKDIHMRPDGVRLKHHAETPLVGRQEDALTRGKDREPVHDDLTAHRALQARDGAQGRRLAASGRPEKREELSIRHVEGHVLSGFDRRSILSSIFRAERRDSQHGLLAACVAQAANRRCREQAMGNIRKLHHASRPLSLREG